MKSLCDEIRLRREIGTDSNKVYLSAREVMLRIVGNQ